MAKAFAGPRFGRALVNAGIITEEQFHNCEAAALVVSNDQVPRVTINLMLTTDQFDALMPEVVED